MAAPSRALNLKAPALSVKPVSVVDEFDRCRHGSSEAGRATSTGRRDGQLNMALLPQTAVPSR